MRTFWIAGIYLSIIVSACTVSKPQHTVQSQPVKPQFQTIKSSFDLQSDRGVVLRIEIEYQINQYGFLNNQSEAQFLVTNIGKVPYEWKKQEKAKIVFEFTTDDGKIIEQSKRFYKDLSPDRTSSAMTVSVDAGLNRHCTSVKAVRME